MKKVILKQISLVNFKGEKERTTLFNPDVTTISGGNGLGKSRHFDAFIWLLFGKDSQDRKDYEIKTRINGEELHKCECSVTGVIEVDGMEITLKRAFVEDWVKPRGQAEQVYKGNHTECWWNETPVNVSEYTKRIEEIIDSSVFKMITNPAFFSSMKWQLQREQLFQIAGTVTDAEIAENKPEFAVLLDNISGKSLADFKKEISAKKKRLDAELKQIQPRIDQTQKMMPEPEDFDKYEKQIAAIDKECSEIDNCIADVTSAIRKKYEHEQSLQKRINELQSECNNIVFEAREQAQKNAYEANAIYRQHEYNIKTLESEIENFKKEITRNQVRIAQLHRENDKLVEEQNRLRESWFKENEKEYNGETVCPHCGQELPAHMVDKAREIFNNAIAVNCNKISESGKELGELIANNNYEVESLENAISSLTNKKIAATSVLEEQRTEFSKIKMTQAAEIVPESIPTWVEKQKEIETLKESISTETDSVDTRNYQNKKEGLMQMRNECVERLAKRASIEKFTKEIASLEERGKELSQMIADIEKDEFTIEQFTKTKIEECEKRVNSKFKIVTFRMFDFTLDGNPVETCIPLINGVPYGSANTASKVNAGLDIINALCGFYGVCAPIFIDNRESVNEIVPMESQIINLVVTKDNKLTIE